MKRLALAGALLLGACEPVAPQTIADVDFGEAPLDTREQVDVAVDPGARDPAEVELEVRLPEGHPLFIGTGTLPVERPLRLKVPAATDRLEVTARFPDGTETTRSVPVQDGRLALDLDALR